MTTTLIKNETLITPNEVLLFFPSWMAAESAAAALAQKYELRCGGYTSLDVNDPEWLADKLTQNTNSSDRLCTTIIILGTQWSTVAIQNAIKVIPLLRVVVYCSGAIPVDLETYECTSGKTDALGPCAFINNFVTTNVEMSPSMTHTMDMCTNKLVKNENLNKPNEVIVFYPSWMATESAAAALAVEYTLNSIGCTSLEVKDPESFADKIINSTCTDGQRCTETERKHRRVTIILLGTYWSAATIQNAIALFPLLRVVVYCSGAIPADLETYECTSGKTDTLGPCAFITHFVLANVVMSPSMTRTMDMCINDDCQYNHHCGAARFVDDRHMGIDNDIGDEFFSGLYGADRTDGFFRYFRMIYEDKSICVHELIESGKSILRTHTAIAKDRVKTNSMLCTSKSGHVIAVAPASELIILTHKCLHEYYPDVSVTCTITHRFEQPEGATDGIASIQYSLRSWADGVNVETMIKEIGGGGTCTGAGGRVPITDFKLPF